MSYNDRHSILKLLRKNHQLFNGRVVHKIILQETAAHLHTDSLDWRSNLFGVGFPTLEGIKKYYIMSVFQCQQIMAKHTGKTMHEIEMAAAYDHFMDAEEAIAFGPCDHIADHFWGSQ